MVMGKWIAAAAVVLIGVLVYFVATRDKMSSDFTLRDTYGNSVSLSDYSGSVVVLDFWASWCPPCRAAMPAIDRIYLDYASRGVVVLGVNISDNRDPGQFMADMGLSYPTLVHGEQVARDYGVKGIPTLIVVAPDGRIVYRDSGWAPHVEQLIRDAIDDALGG